MKFNDLALCEPLLRAIQEKGYETPTPIQEKAIPAILKGRDVMGAAQTGTGKTASFTLPILERLSKRARVGSNQCRVLILTPTRELAAQVEGNINSYSKYLPLSSYVIYGGVKINPQMMRLRKGVDILVATPGRLLDLFSQRAINFKAVEVLILDEADRMLDMGFIHDIKKIIKLMPDRRQNLMFSATFSKEIRELAKGLINDPIEISIGAKNTTVQTVDHWICPVDKRNKSAALTHLIKDQNWGQTLVFTRTKHGANRLTKHLESKGIKAAAIHGNKSQGARTKALVGIKDGSLHVLVATDLAARGIDIDQLPHVVNFDLPNIAEDYVHRIGRTGRAGAKGQAISLVCADEFQFLKDIERLIQKVIERKSIEGFEAVHKIPETSLDTRPIKPKKPKKPKSLSKIKEVNAGPRSAKETKPRRFRTRKARPAHR